MWLCGCDIIGIWLLVFKCRRIMQFFFFYHIPLSLEVVLESLLMSFDTILRTNTFTVSGTPGGGNDRKNS